MIQTLLIVAAIAMLTACGSKKVDKCVVTPTNLVECGVAHKKRPTIEQETMVDQ